MISSIDVYLLTLSTFLSMIVATSLVVIVAIVYLQKKVRSKGSSNVSTRPFSPICPKPLFQSEFKRKAIDMKIISFLSLCKF